MNDLLTNPRFDLYRAHIEQSRQSGWSWEDLRTLRSTTPDQMDQWFVLQQNFSSWPSLGASPEERRTMWVALVNAKEDAEQRMVVATRPLVVVGREESEPDLNVPQAAYTSWQLYKSHLLSKGWDRDSITPIEESTLKILKRLRKKTVGMQPVRGMVVGHVQSGKTASIAGLSAMAADHGWNLVIVLSGTLENLRRQTLNRLIGDLKHMGNLHWESINHPSDQSSAGHRAQDLHFMPGSTSRYLTVCLKNPKRLSDLQKWLEADSHVLAQMKILIIDDEADQASINASAKEGERTKINQAIIDLTRVKALSVNYVGYTATPAANFLNEGPGDGLYPEDFILALQQSDKHFGPLQIFGAEERNQDALGIINDITDAELTAVRALHDDPNAPVPESLANSVKWYLCAAAAMRTYGIRKPVSMLVHTSQKQNHHANVTEAIRQLLTVAAANKPAFIEQCRKVWEQGQSMLSREDFAERFPDYGWRTEIPDYPEFSDMVPYIEELLNTVSAIRLDEDGALTYHRGIHLCVDNCANNGISDENEIRRLFYPDPKAANAPEFATAFIVVGGSTLARGLTIENLVSSYFLRASIQADSLMQMGRWFGYRQGYELLPRIWMHAETRQKFEFMTLAEEDLRDDLKRFMEGGADPAEFGPRVRVHPRASWLRPTAKNRMRESEGAKYDFSGVNRQTTIFHAGPGSGNIHQKNRQSADNFLGGLQKSPRWSPRGNALVWEGVPFERIAELLGNFQFHPNTQFFSDIKPFISWYREQASAAGYGEWSVIVAGTVARDDKAPWIVAGEKVSRVERTRVRERSTADAVSIGTLREPLDLLSDVTPAPAVPERLSNEAVAALREAAGLGSTPQLLLYLIDKASAPTDKRNKDKDDSGREPLGAAEDIVGVSLWLPRAGDVRRTYATHVTVRIPTALAGEDDDILGTGTEG